MNFNRLSAYIESLQEADIKNLVCVVSRNHEVIFRASAISYTRR